MRVPRQLWLLVYSTGQAVAFEKKNRALDHQRKMAHTDIASTLVRFVRAPVKKAVAL